MSDAESVACPHCGSHNLSAIPPVYLGSHLTWLRCGQCGRTFSSRIPEPLAPRWVPLFEPYEPKGLDYAEKAQMASLLERLDVLRNELVRLMTPGDRQPLRERITHNLDAVDDAVRTLDLPSSDRI